MEWWSGRPNRTPAGWNNGMDTPLTLRHHEYDFCRPTDWRWREACSVVRDGRGTIDGSDPIVARLAAYLPNADSARDHDGQIDGHGWPGFAAARRLYEDGGPLRMQVEAYLLTGLDDEAVAARCGLTKDVVSNYELVFFNVRERLGAPDWVVSAALGRRHAPRDERSAAVYLLKGFAYFGGRVLLDAILPYLGCGDLGWLERLPPAGTFDGRLARGLKVALLIELVSPIGRHMLALCAVNTEMLARSRAANGLVEWNDSFLDGVIGRLEAVRAAMSVESAALSCGHSDGRQLLTGAPACMSGETVQARPSARTAEQAAFA